MDRLCCEPDSNPRPTAFLGEVESARGVSVVSWAGWMRAAEPVALVKTTRWQGAVGPVRLVSRERHQSSRGFTRDLIEGDCFVGPGGASSQWQNP